MRCVQQRGKLSRYRDGLQAGWLGFDSRKEVFLYSTVFRPALGHTQPPIRRLRGLFPRGVKWPGREADHSTPPCAEVKNVRAIAPLSHMASAPTLPLPMSCMINCFRKTIIKLGCNSEVEAHGLRECRTDRTRAMHFLDNSSVLLNVKQRRIHLITVISFYATSYNENSSTKTNKSAITTISETAEDLRS
jgi:hypothetical protein